MVDSCILPHSVALLPLKVEYSMSLTLFGMVFCVVLQILPQFEAVNLSPLFSP